ncbi:GNAT family N-acetyltransferase [Intrasporangium sp.]|uniref:GNAT family N-acetyltransferase n=1 Tax=Intrasporangium sp. TaxID=1925024 RepID=UPI00293A3074|nr:GNAT family N-acetyltransferase [Intrasporangium sp.]MDV3221093.1 GNAT family N-acetyltransferase [Intrasporangium sp.]
MDVVATREGGAVTGQEGEATAWIATARLELRRPGAPDFDDYVRLHTDPRTYAHKPAAMPTPEQCEEWFAAVLERWRDQGIDYAVIRERDAGGVLGWAGLRVVTGDGPPHLNLYFRLAAAAHGRGLGREVARALTAWATEHRPELPVQAVVAPVNVASLRTCAAAGLVEVSRKVHPDFPDDEPDIILQAPRLRVTRGTGAIDTPFSSDTLDTEALVDVWRRVNDTGGAVGFLPGAPVDEVRAALEQHLEVVRGGTALLVELREPTGALCGYGFWEHAGQRGFEHVATLKRLMVDPAVQGRNLGSVLLAGMVGVVRRELEGVILLLLDYRSGLGLGDFYARAGWTEVGRLPGAIWLEGDDYRDDVFMARRVDGRPVVSDGRA